MKKLKYEQIILPFVWPGIHMYQGFPPLKAWTKDFAALGFPLKFVAVSYSKGTLGFYVLKSDYENAGKKFFEKIKNYPETLFKILKEVDFTAEKIFKLIKKWERINFVKLPNSTLTKCQKELAYWDEKLWRFGQPQNLLELHNNYLTQYVRKIIKKHFGSKKELEVFKILTTSTIASKMELQDNNFVELFKRTQNISLDKLRKSPLLQVHWEKYTWMIFGWEGPALEKNYFYNNLVEARKNKNIVRLVQKRLKEKEQILKKQFKLLDNFSENEKKLVLLLRTLVDSKTKRVDAHSATYYLATSILSEIAKRLGLSLSQIRVLDPKKVKNLFRKVSVDRINDEYNLVVYWYKKGQNILKFTGPKALEKMEYIRAQIPKAVDSNIIKGELAYQGKVRGKVRVVLYAKGFTNFKKGEILVTKITDPSYVLIMKLAKAVVTDIGGITSHAAIVARELKKPCIIGTKIGTEILKDGDLVEVDANKGIVRKL